MLRGQLPRFRRNGFIQAMFVDQQHDKVSSPGQLVAVILG